MIEKIILQHKREKESYNLKDYVFREKLSSAYRFLDNNLIKVIAGPRRAGKSVFSFLLLKDKDFAYLNFEDENLLKIKNYDEFLKGICEVYPDSKFVFFDEIQNLKKWEIFANKLQRRGYNLIITGSNSRLLSKELAASLTGRYILLEVFTFSFKEFLKAKNIILVDDWLDTPESKGKILGYLDAYLVKGGFPEVVIKDLEPKEYLQTLFDGIIFKDIVKRYNVRFPQKIYDLALYMISNCCNEFSFTKLRNNLGFRSTVTIQNYLRYLEEAYLFLTLNRFSFKIKEQIKAPKKIYIIDNGLITAKSFQFSPNSGRLMENLVLGEILRRGNKLNQDVFYYKTRNGREVDFIIREGLRVKNIIQVSRGIEDSEAGKREFKSLAEASQELGCDDLIIITWDKEGEEIFKGKKVKLIPLWKWLLKG